MQQINIDREIIAQRMSDIISCQKFDDFCHQYNCLSDRFAEMPSDAKLALYYQLKYGECYNLSLETNSFAAFLYDRTMVSIDDFLENPNYLGVLRKNIFPKWREDMRSFFSEDSVKREWVFSGSIGTGKTTIARIGSLFKLHNLLCLRFPQATFGLTPEAPITMTFIGISQKKAKETALKPFVSLLRMCSAFEELDDQNKLLTYSGDKLPFCYNIADNVVRFSKNISVNVSSSIDDLIGQNIFCAFFDEAESGGNTREVLELYTELKNRIKSRFGISRYSFASIISSARKQNGVIQTYLSRLTPEDLLHVQVSEYTKWDVVTPSGQDPLAEGFFYALNGSTNFPSQMLTLIEGELWEKNTELIPSGTELLKIPLMYYSDFKQNLEKALQDIAGRPTATNANLFADVSTVQDTRLVPSLRISIPTVVQGIAQQKQLEHDMLAYLPAMCTIKAPNADAKRDTRWYRYNSAPRYMHVDLAEVGEAALCMLHKELDMDTGLVVYVVDLLVTFYSPTRIRLESIYEFGWAVKRKYGFNIHTASYDQYQSATFRQRAEEDCFAQNNILLSLDRIPDAYRYAANVTSQGCFKVGHCSENDGLLDQMRAVAEDENGKIVKPMLNQKNHLDALDAIVGAMWNAYQNRLDVPHVMYTAANADAEQSKEALIAKSMERLRLGW